ncbi:hypothetical protein [Sphingomonas bacterium]|uniref:hypothetical protein n=1 Tax=Sphingomonas bacterium TaxID=1895847 RepID=UPI001577622B|nr:hypothetical protein [Sphingomonas bacterium]
MNPFQMVVAIVVVVMVARVLRDRYRAQAAMPPPQADDDLRRMAEEMARLRERVQVLERVVTDGHQASDLDRQIDRLRDR